MITPSDLEKYDPSGMHKVYDRWPQIAKEAFYSDIDEVSLERINHVVFAGMGGSGAIGDLFASIFSKTNFHVTLVKGYLLPNTIDKNTLVVVTSISGNSKETLNVLESSIKMDCHTIAFSSGGKIEEICSKNNINFRKIEKIHSPRASFVKYVYSILKVLNKILPISKLEVEQSFIQLEKICNEISFRNLSTSNESLRIATWITGIPLIYYPYGLQSVAIRFKSSLQENVKIHAITEDIIEACHNGIVAWETKSNVQPILIQGKDDYVKTKERWSIVKKYFDENSIEYLEVRSVDGHIFTKLICMIYLLDCSSIFKAVMDKTDPSPVRSIDYIKNNL
ncbi:MAG: SIS domain-containing protein [Nitrosopumilus sp.]|uniref:SIS domain-containing protein n=1 Tax=Nitrosopumilus sp. TaxID=2024843 RepID=UPI00247B47EB|nr:SIS domain-containing protein [Nitrosopumilus sp.]MCV0393515.1 SIS domain-containing protein [Nitrosopumilus sp.]